VSKGSERYKFELKNEDNKLSDYHFSSTNQLIIEKGKPMRKGEIVIKFYTFSYSKEGYEIGDLFKLPLPEKMAIKDAKSEVVKHFRELQLNEETKRTDNYDIGDEEHIRLRELFCKCPSSIFLDNVTIKEASRLFTPEIAVEKVPNGEIKAKGHIVCFIQQFFPSRFEVGDVHEISTYYDEELDSLRKRITELTGCKNVALTIGERWESFKLLNIPNMFSFKPAIKEENDSNGDSSDNENESDDDDDIKSKMGNRTFQNPIYTVRRLQVRDGDIVYFWDCTESLKKLSDEEKKSNYSQRKKSKITKKSLPRQRRITSYSRKRN